MTEEQPKPDAAEGDAPAEGEVSFHLNEMLYRRLA